MRGRKEPPQGAGTSREVKGQGVVTPLGAGHPTGHPNGPSSLLVLPQHPVLWVP